MPIEAGAFEAGVGIDHRCGVADDDARGGKFRPEPVAQFDDELPMQKVGIFGMQRPAVRPHDQSSGAEGG